MNLKRFLLTLSFVMTLVTVFAQQDKRVYITLDVSGSMSGNKYALANYTTQMIVTLCDESDEVSLIVVGKENKLTQKKEPLKLLQHPLAYSPENPLIPNGSNLDDEIRDILVFNSLYKPSKTKQDWVFIIGDGVWHDACAVNYDEAIKGLEKNVESGPLNVCYLQTGQSLIENNDFTKDVASMGVVDIGKSSIEPQTIIDGCNHFARKILGFSDVPLKVNREGKRCVTIKAELPLSELYLVYQDEVVPTQLPNVNQAKWGENDLSVVLKGTPSTIPTKKGGEVIVDLSGNVWHLKSNGIIPAKTEIKVCFDKDIDLNKVTVYPLIKEVEFRAVGLTLNNGKLKQLDSKTYSICRDESKAIVRVEVSGQSKDSIPESMLKATKVVVKSDNKEYEAVYKGGSFECEIDLDGEETLYYSECDCPGYFKRVTPISKIVKGDCEPVLPPELDVKESPTTDLGSITFERLRSGTLDPIWLQDSLSHDVLNPKLFNIKLEVENDILYEEPKFHIENDTLIILEVRPKGKWCECLFPETLKMRLVSTPTEEAVIEYGKTYNQNVFPMELHVIKERPWLARCFWVIVTLVALLLFMLYLRGLLRKNRFKKTARMENSYVEDENSRKEVQKKGRLLREKGFLPWLNRWFNPFTDERRSMSFTRPKTKQLTFVASKSKERVLLTKSCFDEKTMNIASYDPKADTARKEEKYIKLSEGEQIEIKDNHRTRLGHLTFTTARKDDEGGYRFFISILMALSVFSFVVLLWLLLRGLW